MVRCTASSSGTKGTGLAASASWLLSAATKTASIYKATRWKSHQGAEKAPRGSVVPLLPTKKSLFLEKADNHNYKSITDSLCGSHLFHWIKKTVTITGLQPFLAPSPHFHWRKKTTTSPSYSAFRAALPLSSAASAFDSILRLPWRACHLAAPLPALRRVRVVRALRVRQRLPRHRPRPHACPGELPAVQCSPWTCRAAVAPRRVVSK